MYRSEYGEETKISIVFNNVETRMTALMIAPMRLGMIQICELIDRSDYNSSYQLLILRCMQYP